MNTQLTSIISECLAPAVQESARRTTIKSTHLRVELLEARMLLSVDGFGPSQLENVIVGLDMADRPQDLAHYVNSSLGGRVGHIYQHALKGFAASLPPAAVHALKANPRVEYVVPDVQFEIAAQETPYGIQRIGADLNPEGIAGTVDVDVDIAILDTGIDVDHPDLNVQEGVNFVRKGTDTYDDGNGHGTHVAGTAGALDNGLGVVGVAPGARLWPVRVLHSNGRGDLSDILAGMDWVIDNSDVIDVVNMSLTGWWAPPPMEEAIDSMISAGVVLVAAAGNGGYSVPDAPAYLPGVLAVSAMIDTNGVSGGEGPTTEYGADDTFASFSNYGEKIELAAPGVDVLSTWKGGGYDYSSGTSMAAPHVSGAAALFVSEYDAFFSDDALDVALVRQALIASGQPQDEWGPPDTNERDAHAEPLVDASGNWANGNWVTQPVASVPFEMNPWLGSGEVPVVSGEVTMQIDARDVDTALGDLNVWVEIDGLALPDLATYQSASGMYQVVWDTTSPSVGDGEHTVVAFASDIHNHTSDEAAALTVNNLTVLVDNISLPSVSIVAEANAAEEGRVPGLFTVSRTGDKSENLEVRLVIEEESSADNGVDYSLSGLNPPLFDDMITILVGSSTASIDVIPVDDGIPEGTEDVIVRLVGDAAYTLSTQDSATVVILDNDGIVDDFAVAETAIYGSVSGDVFGDYRDTHFSDDNYEDLTEESFRRGKASRLQHEWTFNVTGGSTMTFFVEAQFTSARDDFRFEYSTDRASWVEMLTLTEPGIETTQQFELPSSIAGPLYVRVHDTDRSSKDSGLDTISVDQMFIRSEGTGASVQSPVRFASAQAESVWSGPVERASFWLAAAEDVLPANDEVVLLPAAYEPREARLALPEARERAIDRVFGERWLDNDDYDNEDQLTGL